MVPLFIQVGPIHGEIVARRGHGLLRSLEGIHETDLLPSRHFLHDLKIGTDVFVVPISRAHSLHVLVGDGRDQYDVSCSLTVVGLGLDALQILRQALTKGGQTFLAREGLVVPEGGQHNIRLHGGEVLSGVGKISGTRLQVHLVRRPGQVADD